MSHDAKGDQSDHDRVIRTEERLCQQEAAWIAHAKVHELEGTALQLQHVETGRRLGELNHENARVLAAEGRYATHETVGGLASQVAKMLPREVYESTQKEVATKAEVLAATVSGKPSMEQHESLDARVKNIELNQVQLGDVARNADRIKIIEDWKNKAMGAAVILTLISGAVGAVIAKALGG